MRNHVFVSHSHQDAASAEQIVQALEKRGVACWMAPRDVPPGGSYAEAILNAIESASCFVLIYSENSNVSSHVVREVERALKLDLNIVPVRFDNSAPSKSLDYLLATVHWLAIAPESRDRSIVKAADQIAAWMAKSGGPPQSAQLPRVPSPVPAALPPAAPRPSRLLLWIPILLVIVASLIWWRLSQNSAPSRETVKNEVVANAATPSPTTTKAMGPAASASVSPDADELPVAVTQRYFSLLAKRNASAAYNLLSEEFRLRISMLKFSRTVGFKPAVKLLESTQISKTDRNATVAASFEDTDPAANQAHWKGNIDFVLESGAWRISSMKGLYPASGRLIQNPQNSDEEATQNVSQPTPTPVPMPQPTKSPPPAASPTPNTQKMRGIVHGDSAALHERPVVRARVVTPLKEGDRLEIDRIEGDWLHATTEGKKSGWVHKNKVKINP